MAALNSILEHEHARAAFGPANRAALNARFTFVAYIMLPHPGYQSNNGQLQTQSAKNEIGTIFKTSKSPRKSWEDYGAVIVVQNLGEAAALADDIAPEHLELCIASPEALSETIRNAGAIFRDAETSPDKAGVHRTRLVSASRRGGRGSAS